MSDQFNVYLDHHATTPVRPEVAEAMKPWLTGGVGNAASAHSFGRRARNAIETSRELVAHCVSAKPSEVVFTSGATEANNLALFGLVGAKPAHIAVTPIEHPCVLEPLQQLASHGHTIQSLRVTHDGIAQLPEPPTELLVIMRVNHETGAIQPIPRHDCWHCDAAQAAGKIPLSFRDLGPATMTISGHKFGAPQGVGALIVRSDVKLRPLLFGGHQQQGRRPGTESVPLIVGLATALENAIRDIEHAGKHVYGLRQRLLDRLGDAAAPIAVNGPIDSARQSPYVLNVSFPGLRADALLMALDGAGVACSTGSACSSGSLLPSPVLKAMGAPDNVLRSAMRFSFSASTTLEEIELAAERIVAAVNRLRAGQGRLVP